MQPSILGRQRTPASARSATSASLSVVVVSSGSVVDSQNAARALTGASRDYHAQLIFVSQRSDPGLIETVEGNGGEFVAAPAGSSRAEMCDLGMNLAKGAIVAVRDDTAVGNAQWLDAYRSVLPRQEVVRPPAESVVMDTLVAGRAPLADMAVPRQSAESRSREIAGEVAAAV